MKSGITGITQRVKDFILKNRLVDQGDRVLLSLSAGKDSMALFGILHYLRNDLGITLAVFHLNHLSRGGESDEDENFVEALAKRYGSDIFIERHDFSTRRRGVSFEDHARKIRYEHLNSLAERYGYRRIATAHTASDNAETILMRMFRGTGVAGLGGIEPLRGRIIRPLLAVSSMDVYNYLREKEIAWRDDATNSDTVYLRNFIRADVLPRIYARFPGGEDALVHLGGAAHEYQTLIRDLLIEKYQNLYDRHGNEAVIRYSRFGGDERILKYALSTAMRECFNEFIHRGMISEIVKKIHVKRSNLELFRSGTISVTKTLMSGESVIKLSGVTQAKTSPGGRWEYTVDVSGIDEKIVHISEIGLSFKISTCDIRFFSENYLNPDILFLALPADSRYIIIRNRLNGDRIRLPFGLKKVKKLMIENKLDSSIKDTIPLIYIDSRVAAIMFGLFSTHQNRVAEGYLVSRNTKNILAICGVRPSPDREMK